MLTAVLRAGNINRLLGGAIVGPWDIDQISDDWLDALDAMSQDLPGYKQGVQKVEDILEKHRREHPTYRK